MKNKSSFNSGHSRKISGTNPINRSVTVGSVKNNHYSKSELVNSIRRKTGEDCNQLQDKLKKEFEKYLRDNELETGKDISLDILLNIIPTFLQTQQKKQMWLMKQQILLLK